MVEVQFTLAAARNTLAVVTSVNLCFHSAWNITRGINFFNFVESFYFNGFEVKLENVSFAIVNNFCKNEMKQSLVAPHPIHDFS